MQYYPIFYRFQKKLILIEQLAQYNWPLCRAIPRYNHIHLTTQKSHNLSEAIQCNCMILTCRTHYREWSAGPRCQPLELFCKFLVQWCLYCTCDISHFYSELLRTIYYWGQQNLPGQQQRPNSHITCQQTPQFGAKKRAHLPLNPNLYIWVKIFNQQLTNSEASPKFPTFWSSTHREKMVSVDEIRRAQRAEGPASILAIGTANPPNAIEQCDYPDYYFRITSSEHKVELKEKFKRMCKISVSLFRVCV